MLRKVLLPTANSIPPNNTAGTATIDLPLGYRYHSLGLRLGVSGINANKETLGTLANNFIGDIRVKLNGKVQRTMSAKELSLINASYGSAFALKTSATISATTVVAVGAAGYNEYHQIWFAEPWRKSNAQAAASAWNVAGQNVNSFQVEVDFKAITTGVPTISGWMEIDQPTGPMGTISKWVRQNMGAAGTIQDFNNLDRRDFVQALKIFPVADGSAFVSKAKLTANGLIIQDTIDRLQQDANLLGREMTPAPLNATSAATIIDTGLFNLDLDYDDMLQGALDASKLSEMTLQVQYASAITLAAATAAGTLPVIMIRAGAPD